MTRGVRVHSERGSRGLHAQSGAAGTSDTVGDVPHRTCTPRVSIASFRRAVWVYWKKNGRHDLPWRKTTNPYRILVSEVMLQQTQVPRVIEKYKEFLKAFPTVQVLARAPLARVLGVWSGLGYNRRAKYLHDAAKIIVREHGGRITKEAAALRALPGLGPYTTSAVRVFAFNEPDILIETNIRAVYIHYFYSSILQKTRIADKQILPLATKAAEGQEPREWHWALMDYGVHIKKLHKNPARKSAHYTKQSKFEGSLRQVRGEILRELHKGPSSLKSLQFDKGKVQSALASLAREGLIRKNGSLWST